MRLQFTRSAARHGISRERVEYVVEHCLVPLEEPDLSGVPDGVLFLGFDWLGVALEVIAIRRPGGDLLVIHAMALRRGYRASFEEVMGWRE